MQLVICFERRPKQRQMSMTLKIKSLIFIFFCCGFQMHGKDGECSMFVPSTSTVNCNSSILNTIHGYAEIENVTGGEGLTTYIVTNTNDSGSGSYREALSQGNRYITFSPGLTNQTISLQSDAFVYNNNITLDGRDAPGLIISNHATKFEGTNYVLAYMNYHFNNATPDTDGITFRNAPLGGQKFYVYKCHFRNASDGSIDVIWNRGNDVHGTVSHCKFEYVDKNFLIHSGGSTPEGGTYYLTCDNNWFLNVANVIHTEEIVTFIIIIICWSIGVP